MPTTWRRERPSPTSVLLSLSLVSLGLGAALGAALLAAFGLVALLSATRSVSDDAYGGVYERALPGVVQVVDRTRLGQSPVQWSLGSGFVVDREGHVLTSYHVARGARDIGVVFGDGQDILSADVVGEDPSHDLALLSVDAPAERLHPLPLGDSSKLRIGQPVVAIGSPFGLSQSLTRGIVSYLGRRLDIGDGVAIDDAIQIDSAINPGNSGGPLLNLRGEVVGVTSASVQKDLGSFQAGSVGIGFAIPSSHAAQVLPEMASGALRSRPSLGVLLRDGKPNSPSGAARSCSEGTMVMHVLLGSAADEAGLRGAKYTLTQDREELGEAGDVILAIDGLPVKSASDLAAYLESSGVGDVVTLRVAREGGISEISARLRARDATMPDAL